jgi:hypothetical protein
LSAAAELSESELSLDNAEVLEPLEQDPSKRIIEPKMRSGKCELFMEIVKRVYVSNFSRSYASSIKQK